MSKIDTVQLEGLVVMKILKHCRESLPDLVNGQVLGLTQDNRLEATNCFPFPSRDDDDEDGIQYQLEMMRVMREINVDHMHVGWYQSTYLGSFLNTSLIDTQFNYQKAIEGSVVIIYDPLKTTQGSLSLKAYRLTQHFMNLFKDTEFSADSPKLHGLTHESVFEEVPITIHNSNLANALLLELESSYGSNNVDRVDLNTTSLLEKNLELLIDTIDDLVAEQNKFQYYQRGLTKLQQILASQLQKRRYENEQRIANGEKPLPDDDIIAAHKPPTPPSHLDTLLYTSQIGNYCKQISQFSTQASSKLFIADKLQK